MAEKIKPSLKNNVGWLFGVFSIQYCIHAIMYLGNTTGTYYFNSSMAVIAKSLTDNMVLVGLLASIYSVTAMVCRPLSGIMCEKYGRIKTNVIGLIFTALAIVGFMLSPNIYWLLFSRVINGIAFSMTSSANYAGGADLSPEDNLPLGIGWFGNMSRLSSFIGPSVAAWGMEQYNATGSWMALYAVALATTVFSLLLCIPLNYEKMPWFKERQARAKEERENKENNKPVDGPVLPQMKKIFGMTSAAWVCWAMLMFEAAGHQSVGAYLLLSANERGLTGLASYFLLQTVGMFVASGLLCPLTKKIGTFKILAPIFVIAVFCYIGFANATSTLMLCIIAPFYGLLHGTCAAVNNTNIVASCPLDRRGFASSMYLLAIDVGYGIGPFIWALVIQAVGYANMYYFTTICPIASLILLCIYWFKWGKNIFTSTRDWEIKQKELVAANA